MKVTNLFESTQVLQRAKDEIIEWEPDVDKRAYIVNPNLEVKLVDQYDPSKELFPSKANQKNEDMGIKGNTSPSEVKRILGS